jgi:hypothetical protein
MFTKRTILAALVIVVMALALPNWANAVELYNDNGAWTTYFPAMPVNWICTVTLSPSYTEFEITQVKFFCYGSGTFTYKIHIYEDGNTVHSTDCYAGEVDCSGPQQRGDSIYVSPQYTYTVGAGINTVTRNIPALPWLQGPFCVGIEYTGANTSCGLLADGQSPIDCCVDYWWRTWGPDWMWMEHYDVWVDPLGFGYFGVRAIGNNHGTPNPGDLQTIPDRVFYGHAATGGYLRSPEQIDQTVVYRNSGGDAITVTALTSLNPDFWWTGDPLPWNLASGQQKSIVVSFQPAAAGSTYGNIIATVTQVEDDTLELWGIGFDGLWLENFYQDPDPVTGTWYIASDSSRGFPWSGYYGGYSDQDFMMGHPSTDFGHPDSLAIDWALCDTVEQYQIPNPGGGVKATWMNRNSGNSTYGYHGFYWTRMDCVYWWLVDEIPPTFPEGGWVVEGPHYVNTPADPFMIGYLYMGNDAWSDTWFIDDVMMEELPQIPPEFKPSPAHEHHSDDGVASFVSPGCTHITVHVLDANADLMTVNLHYADLTTMTWNTTPMSEVVGCESMHLWEGTVCDLDTCHTYGYYFSASDPGGSGQTTYLPATAPTNYYRIDIMDNAQPQIAYDNGNVYYVRYDPDYWEQRFAVRFTPASYPYYLGGAMIMIGAPAQSFPDDDHEDIVGEVYDDNGAGGSPGTLLGVPSSQNGTSWNEGQDACDDTTFAKWVYIKFNPCIEITNGDFYIAVRNRDGSVGTDKDAFGYDNGPQSVPYRTWIFYGDIGRWRPDSLGDPQGHTSANLMLRAIECPCDLVVPTDVTVYKDPSSSNKIVRWTDMGVPYYYVYRSTTGPYSGFTKVATTTDTSYVDATPTKAFFHVKGSCYESLALPEEPPVVDLSLMTAVGPVRRVPSGLQETLRIGEEYTLEQQLQAGVPPKMINKAEFARIARQGFKRTSVSGWTTK